MIPIDKVNKVLNTIIYQYNRSNRRKKKIWKSKDTYSKSHGI